MGRKKIKKENPQQPKRKKIIQHLFRTERVEEKKKQGWEIVGQAIDKRTGVPDDIVLMQKEI